MQKKLLKFSTIVIMLFSIFLISCSNKNVETKTSTLRISAAASLTESLNQIKGDFEKKENAKLEYNFGSSGALANQITQADVCDVFISASKKHMEIVSSKDLAENKINMFSNKLVLISPKENKTIKSTKDILKSSKIALGEVESVPVGKYSKEALTKLNIWDTLDKDKKIVFAKDVKSVLKYVESGEVDCGIVYLSDATKSDKVSIVETIDPSMHSPIIYPAAIIKTSKNKDLAKKFIEYIKQNPNVFEKNGFTVIK